MAFSDHKVFLQVDLVTLSLVPHDLFTILNNEDLTETNFLTNFHKDWMKKCGDKSVFNFSFGHHVRKCYQLQERQIMSASD